MTLTDGQKQAYARVGLNILGVWALELRHSTFLAPVRIVNAKTDITHTLEATAPVDPDTAVLFSALAFSLEAPKVNDESLTTVRATLDGVSGFVQPYLAAANQTSEPIEATLRELLYDVSTDTVLQQPATFHLRMVQNRSSMTSVAIELGRINSANQPFPNEFYTPTRNPGLE